MDKCGNCNIQRKNPRRKPNYNRHRMGITDKMGITTVTEWELQTEGCNKNSHRMGITNKMGITIVTEWELQTKGCNKQKNKTRTI